MNLKMLYAKNPKLFGEVIMTLSPKKEKILRDRVLFKKKLKEMSEEWKLSADKLVDELQSALIQFMESYYKIKASGRGAKK